MRINIEEYYPNWKNQFEIEKKILKDLLKDYFPKIEHIGSTAIENCPAKPIIDILVGLESEDDFDNVINVLTQKQYVYFKVFDELMPDIRFFVKY